MNYKYLHEWMRIEKDKNTDNWMWRLIAKHFAFGLNIPIQLGSLDKLSKLHNLILEYINIKERDQFTSITLKKKLNKIKIQFSDIEKFNAFVTSVFKEWNTIANKFVDYFQEKQVSNKNNLSNSFIESFICDNSEIINNFKGIFAEEDGEYYHALKKIFNYLELNVWKTNGYYTMPLFTAFSYYAPWRWISLLWYYYQLVIAREPAYIDQDWYKSIFPKNGAKKDFYLFPYWQLSCLKRNKKVNNERIFFVLGPVFSPEKIYFDDWATFHNKIKPVLFLFRIFNKLSDEITKRSFTNSLTQADVFLNACGTKPYIYFDTLNKGTERIKNLFDILLRTEFDDFDDLKKPYRHYLVLVSLLRWSLFISNTLESMPLYIFRLKFPFIFFKRSYPKITRLYYNVDIRKQKSIIENIKQSGHRSLFVIASEIKNKKVVSLKINPNFLLSTGKYYSSTNNIILSERKPKYYFKLANDVLNWIDFSFISFNSDFDIRTRTFKQPYLMAAWMRRHFYIQVESNRREYNKNHRPICKKICELFDADVAIIYTYHHAQESLKLMSSWFADKHDKIYEEELRDKIANLSQIEMKESIAYRAINSNTVQFTLSFSPKNGLSVPERHPLLNFKKLQMRSAIAVPLLFKGRVLGVLEIAGKKSYQFAWSNREVLNQTSSVLSTAFYQQRLVHALHRINTTALNLKEDNKIDSYNLICKHLASIFLCDGVSLWFNSEKDRNRYNCHGAYNNEYIQKQLKADASAVAYSADDIYSLAAKELLQNSKLCTDTYEIGVEPLGKAWLKSSPLRKKLEEQGIKYYKTFALRDERNEFCGSIGLYDKNNIGYEEWDSMFVFIDNFVSVVLEAVRALEEERKTIQAKKDHEVIGAAKAVLERLNRFFYLCNHEADLFDSPKKCTEKFQKDIAWGQDLKRRLNLVKGDLATQLQKLKSLSQDIRYVAVENTEKLNEKLNLLKAFNAGRSSYFYQLRKHNLECELIKVNHELIFMEKNDLTIIIENLISNASKYSLPKTSIKAYWEKTDVGWQFRIKNRGFLLADSEQYRIFQDGFRSEYANNNKIEGRGMGLPIVRNICDKYGIEIYYTYRGIKDNPGQCWHTFTLEIPEKMIIKNI